MRTFLYQNVSDKLIENQELRFLIRIYRVDAAIFQTDTRFGNPRCTGKNQCYSIKYESAVLHQVYIYQGLVNSLSRHWVEV